MGYFSNGMEGARYQERYCNRCLHDVNEDCPVWLLHLAQNSDAVNNDDHPLHWFIPLTKDGIGNERCVMFVDMGEPK